MCLIRRNNFMKKICIIGAGGVGKAHAIAALKWFHEQSNDVGILYLVDFKDVLERKYNAKEVTNSWGPIKDVYMIPENAKVVEIFIDNKSNNEICSELRSLCADCYIIATPTPFHFQYLNALRGNTIICEKPIVHPNDIDVFHNLLYTFSPSEWAHLHLGIEWLYHPKLKNINNITKIDFTHGYVPEAAAWDIKYHIHDLGSHVVHLYQHLTGENIIPIESVQTILDENERVTNLVTDEGVLLRFGYVRWKEEDFISISHKHILDWIPMMAGDLFYLQLKHVMETNVPLLSLSKIIAGNNLITDIYKRTITI